MAAACIPIWWRRLRESFRVHPQLKQQKGNSKTTLREREEEGVGGGRGRGGGGAVQVRARAEDSMFTNTC